MFSSRSVFGAAAVIITALLGMVAANAQGVKAVQSGLSDSPQLRTTDYMVPHISTVHANAGAWVELFLREKVSKGGSSQRPVVVMIHGATISAIPDFDLQFENYSWMDFLANAGFDVFTFDHTGYGFSPRPMMDNPCNASQAEQRQYLVGSTLTQPCAASYPFQLTTLMSDVDEIARVVDYIRDLRSVDKVHLIGWSRGGNRAAAYAAQHPERVDKMLLLAPGQYFSDQYPTTPPSPLPLSGVPTTILGLNDFHSGWDTQVGCPNQVSPLIRDHINWSMLAFDPTGGTWGAGGVRRAPTVNNNPLWIPWNKDTAAKVVTPTLIVNGDLDRTVPPVQVSWLYDDLVRTPQKIRVHVACASHYLIWETQHEVLLRASEEWLQKGTFAGHANGIFAVDSVGQIRPEATSAGTSK